MGKCETTTVLKNFPELILSKLPNPSVSKKQIGPEISSYRSELCYAGTDKKNKIFIAYWYQNFY
jgi:hypothetical protein